MNSQKCVIVIGRQYGSGGRRLAETLARRLNMNFYDKKLLAKASESYGFQPGIFAQADEKKPSPLRSFLSHSYGLGDSYGMETLSSEKIYEAQCKVIRNICEKENCIIVGRTADRVMRDNPNMVSIFLHAPVEHRARLILERNDASSISEAIDLANHNDRQRKKYYDYFTEGNWGQADNYHLCIDSSLLTLDQAADIILSYLSARGINL